MVLNLGLPIFNRHLHLPVDVSLGPSPQLRCHDVGRWVRDLHHRPSVVLHLARQKASNSNITSLLSKHVYNRKKNCVLLLEPEEKVWMEDHNSQASRKVSPHWNPVSYFVLKVLRGCELVDKVWSE